MQETWNWLLSLDKDFLFLLALPFVVAVLGLAKLAFEPRDKSNNER